MKLDDKETCAAYGRRFGKNRAFDIYNIEGDSVTIVQMAQRVGLTVEQMKSRFKNVRRNHAVITWKLLGVK